MKRKSVFGKSLTFLIVVVLGVMAFLRDDEQFWGLVVTFAAWAVYILAATLWVNKGAIKSRIEKRKLLKRRKDEEKAVQSEHARVFTIPEISEPIGLVLLRHANHRISAYLRSAYPDATWEWCEELPEKIVAKGGRGRIRLYGVSDFNYAEVELDQDANIGCEMMKIVPLAELKSAAAGSFEQPRQPVDPQVWYDIQGRDILDGLIADLHSRGYACLTIRENGDVCITQSGSEVTKDKLHNLPGKSLWPGLVKIMEKEGLSASVTDNGIAVAW